MGVMSCVGLAFRHCRARRDICISEELNFRIERTRKSLQKEELRIGNWTERESMATAVTEVYARGLLVTRGNADGAYGFNTARVEQRVFVVRIFTLRCLMAILCAWDALLTGPSLWYGP